MAMRESLGKSDHGRLRLFPEGTGGALRRRLRQAFGVLLALAGFALFVACFGYNSQDPSLNRASDGSVANLLGLPGAYLADVALQTLGLAVLPAGLLLAAWGWRLLREEALPRAWLRVALLPLVLLALAMAFSALPEPGRWPLRSGLGGFSGDLLLGRMTGATGLPMAVLGFGAAVLGCLLFLYVAGLRRREWSTGWNGARAGAKGAWRGVCWAAGAAALARRSLQRPDSKDDDEDEAEVDVTPARARKARKERREPNLIVERPLAADKAEAPAPAQRVEAEPLVETKPKRPAPGKKGREAAQGRLALGGDYETPPLSLLHEAPSGTNDPEADRDSLEKNARLLEGVLQDFGVRGEIVKVRPGPVVTRYELEPAPGTKTSRVVGLADDIARSMSAISVRVAVVPGSSVIGIELPNRSREIVYLHELLSANAFEQNKGNLPLVLGKDIGGMPQIVDLARMPHLLVAGTTGSGKSVAVNAMILSLLYRLPPDQCKFIMVDPKMLELSVYDGIPHLLAPVVTEPKKAVVALKWVVREMEERYRSMSRLGVRNIDGYNARVEQARKTGEELTRRVQTGFDPDTGQPVYEEQPFDLEPLPFIVVIVDEMADLMLVAGKDVEAAIQRLAQMARAAGIHLIMATQRPSVDVITGTIKANFPTRVSFHVTSKIDSRTILGESGAEHLLGQGDMLYMAQGGRITRVHGPLVTDQEVEEIVAFLKAQGQPSYIESVTEEEGDAGADGLGLGEESSGDQLFDQAVAIVAQHRKASTSFIQRQLQIGYNRAARIVEQMEAQGMVSPANHVGKREVLLPNHGSDA